MALPYDPAVLVAIICTVALAIYARVLRNVAQNGGKVPTTEFAIPDLLLSLFLAGLFTLLAGFTVWLRSKAGAGPGGAPPPVVTSDKVLPGAAVIIVLLGGLVAFLHARGISLTRAFGLDRVSWVRATALALGFILAAFPLVAVSGLLTQRAMRQALEEQELITLFREVAKESDYSAIAQLLIAAVIAAPLWEEFIFRGYFYAVFKRYFGAVAAALVTSAIFAAFHTNLASLPSLFILALCFTIAYEASGSLLVPMSMHALFNASQLAALYWQAHATAT